MLKSRMERTFEPVMRKRVGESCLMTIDTGTTLVTPAMLSFPLVFTVRVEESVVESDTLPFTNSYRMNGKLSAFNALYISSFIAVFPHSKLFTRIDTQTSLCP